MAASSRPNLQDRMFPVKDLTFGDVVVRVRALPAWRVADLAEIFGSAGFNLLTRKFADFRQHDNPLLMATLNDCVTVVEDPSIKVEDVPAMWLPELIGACVDLSMNLGNWKALGERLGLLKPQSQSPGA